MEYRNLGRSGLRVSLLSLGTMNFDGQGAFEKVGPVSPAEAGRLVDLAVDHGVNIFDTSNAYSRGRSETTLGNILKDRSGELLVSTKVRFTMGAGPNEKGLSRHHITTACEASLRRLQRDRVDVYLLHAWDGLTPVDEVLGALDRLIQQGKIRYIGCSNFSGWHLMKTLMIADRYNYERFCCQQIHYTLEAREAEYELVPIALDQGVGIQVWSPLAGGLLAGKFGRNRVAPQVSRHTAGWGEPPIRDEERLYRIIDALSQIAAKREIPVANVALSWLASRPGVSSIVLGARNEAQLLSNLAAPEINLSVEEFDLLEDASLQPLPYPYWHQLNTVADRMSAADLALHAGHLARRQPRP